MTQQNIHPTAVIEPGATLGAGVTVEAYAIIKENVTLGENVTIKSHVYIDGYTTIGEGTTIYPSASIGTQTQNIKYQGEKTYVNIGKNCEIREFVTINSSSGEGTSVEVGDNCFIMAYCHIAHNCVLGKNVIMSSYAALAGHVIVEDNAIIGGMTPIHQFVRIGAYSMVGGMSRIPYDIPPYTIGAGIPFKFGGLNIIGLKRNGFDLETRRELSKAFKLIYRSKLRLEEALDRIEQELKPLDEVKHFLKFCRETQRGLIGLEGITNSEQEYELLEEEEEPSPAVARV